MTRVSSIFSQMLQLFSRTEFERAVVEHRAERHARGFCCWGQFVAMLFCHLGRAQSLREICGGLAASEGKLRHLGLPDAPKRSTLAYANEHRPWQLYRSVFYQLLGRCREVAGTHGFRFKNKLLTLDATLIELCASVFDWAQYRRTKGAVKLHLLLDHQGLLPSFALITEGRVHESRVARSLRFEPGTIVVFDRGYADYDWFASLDADGVFFVTRMKDNADYGVVERRPVPEHGAVRRDEIIFLYKAARSGELRTCFCAASKSGTRNPKARPGVSHQSSRLCRLHHRRHLPPALADRAVLQSAEAEPAHQDLRGHQPQRLADSDLDRSDRPAPAQVPATACPLWLESVQSDALLRQQLFVYRDLFAWIDEPFQPPPLLDPAAEQLALSW